VQAAVGQHRQQRRVLPRRAGDSDAQVGFSLGEVESLGAVGEHRRGGFAGVESPLFDLADVLDEVGLDTARARHQVAEAPQKLVVGNGLERRDAVAS
jgi:hypothetical protein